MNIALTSLFSANARHGMNGAPGASRHGGAFEKLLTDATSTHQADVPQTTASPPAVVGAPQESSLAANIFALLSSPLASLTSSTETTPVSTADATTPPIDTAPDASIVAGNSSDMVDAASAIGKPNALATLRDLLSDPASGSDPQGGMV